MTSTFMSLALSLLLVWSDGAPPEARTSRAEASERIDTIVETALAREGRSPPPLADDWTFVRRVYLDVVGRVPSRGEAEAFVASADPAKRGTLVARLLDSPGHESRIFHWYADLLRAKSKLAKYTSGEPYLHFIKQSIAERKPYDVFVRELLTASGPAHERGNGATGYYLRDRGMPEDNMANTARVFLGTRIECAQCHDHPFDSWTQKQFFELVAFTGGIEYEHQDPRMVRSKREAAEFLRAARDRFGRDATRIVRRVVRPARSGIAGSGTAIARLPDDYKYDDAAPGDRVAAHALFGPEVELPEATIRAAEATSAGATKEKAGKRPSRRARRDAPEEIGSRARLADWMTSPDNPRFTKVIANRMWRLVMGRGLVEPVDDWKDDTAASNPELLAELERLMIDVGYDLRRFLGVVCSTRTYQRESAAEHTDADADDPIAGPRLRRMSAEQIWDSVMTLVIDDVDRTLSPPLSPPAESVYQAFDELVGLDAAALLDVIAERGLRYTDPDEYRAMQQERRRENRLQQRRVRSLLKRLDHARQRGRTDQERSLVAALVELGVDSDSATARTPRILRRASDLPSPAPPDHFLWKFGQSDRETIEAGDAAANVPQVLSLLNGLVDGKLLRKSDAALLVDVEQAGSSEEAVRRAFVRVLGREPTDDEQRLWRDDLDSDRDVAAADLIWTLMNSHEFLFVR